jgi:hypothetical protein
MKLLQRIPLLADAQFAAAAKTHAHGMAIVRQLQGRGMVVEVQGRERLALDRASGRMSMGDWRRPMSHSVAPLAPAQAHTTIQATTLMA